ncbi:MULTISPECIES: beta-ketoacyl synthase N-terminal-like domain-containing protein [unclassified Streptomyces]|uniref:beta-ketoacyl synthase N-terminal-like domain-containing protein n=1 Tax=unclassified Streptomyces TaxID=2593676 RepID=UPI000AF09424|nr:MULTISPECIES: polyketide synthase [unclassified Streptomyces]
MGQDSGKAAGAVRATPVSRAMETIRALREELAALRGDRSVAVVGVGLRAPGGIEDLDGYWSALVSGTDAVRPIPQARRAPFGEAWDEVPHRGGFLDEVLEFDGPFFGVAPREGRSLDPQHRMLLEVVWEALDDAGIPAGRAAAAATGLYVGITGQDYREWMREGPDSYWATGNGHCFAAGRLAHTLGLTGPAMAVDTACSSSLVAVHLARQALRSGECDIAVAGGVNLVLSPHGTALAARTGALSPDGVCRPFDARANGFTRSEGCGIVVLKRLADAVRDGDRVHAVIHGSAVNHDGRASGFTAPNVLAQTRLVERALAEAGLGPADIGHVEAHGTGTPLGDPIEVEALAAALGRPGGTGAPVLLGSAKANLGHTESAAGVLGLIKAMLSLRHRAVPPVPHFTTLNPRIDLSGTGLRVPTELEPWPAGAGAYAGVSSFGMSGTNAHVVLGAPEPDPAPGAAVPVAGFEVSARTPAALRSYAGRLAARLAGIKDEEYAAFAYTVTHGRTPLAARIRVEASDRHRAAAALAAVAEGLAPPEVREVAADAAPGFADLPRRVVDLPAYPWERRRYAPFDAEHPPAG